MKDSLLTNWELSNHQLHTDQDTEVPELPLYTAPRVFTTGSIMIC
jgi:hypothetical protein